MVLKTVSSVIGGGGGGGNGTVTQVNTGTGLTGGPITTVGTVSIANTGVTEGVYGGGSNIAIITVTPQGQINSASNQTITVPNTSVVAGTYGNSTAVGTFTVLSDGRVNAASNVAIANIILGNAQLQVGQTTATVGNLTLNNATINSLTAPLGYAYGGTGLSSPGTNGNVLTSNGTTWVSQAPAAATGNVTYGNTTVVLGGTSSSIGNLTLNAPVINNPTGNVVPAIPAASIPNSLLANSTTTLGNATLTLGGTTTSVGNLTLNNPTVISASSISDTIGPHRDIPQNVQTTAYTLVLTDDGKHISTNSNVTVPNAVFSIGNVVSIYNNSAANITIIAGGGTNVYYTGNNTSANRILQTRGLATILCVAANTFVLGGGGVV